MLGLLSPGLKIWGLLSLLVLVSGLKAQCDGVNADCSNALFPCDDSAAFAEAVEYCLAVEVYDDATNLPAHATAACGTDKSLYIAACGCPVDCPSAAVDPVPDYTIPSSLSSGSDPSDLEVSAAGRHRGGRPGRSRGGRHRHTRQRPLTTTSSTTASGTTTIPTTTTTSEITTPSTTTTSDTTTASDTTTTPDTTTTSDTTTSDSTTSDTTTTPSTTTTTTSDTTTTTTFDTTTTPNTTTTPSTTTSDTTTTTPGTTTTTPNTTTTTTTPSTTTTTTQPPTPTDGNLLENGDFERGLSPWSIDLVDLFSTSYALTAPGGGANGSATAYEVRMSTNAQTRDLRANLRLRSDLVFSRPLQPLAISFWVRFAGRDAALLELSANGGPPLVAAPAMRYGPGGDLEGSDRPGPDAPIGGNWTRVMVDYTTPDRLLQLAFAFELGPARENTVWLDQVVIYPASSSSAPSSSSSSSPTLSPTASPSPSSSTTTLSSPATTTFATSLRG